MWPALAIIAASMFAKHMANQQAADRQNQLQQAMAAYQRSRALQNEAATKALISQQTPDARATELKNIDASRQASMTGTVDAARAASPVTQVAGTNTSGDYQRASTAAADTVAARTKKAIEQLGLMGAPGEQGIASGIRFGRAAGDVDAGNAAIANVGAGYMRDINNVRPNPWLSMAGDIGMGVGGGMLGGAGGAGATTAGNADWGSLDAGPGAYTQPQPSLRGRLSRAFSLWGR